jgi:mannan endo-1,4-beta-mannosidase
MVGVVSLGLIGAGAAAPTMAGAQPAPNVPTMVYWGASVEGFPADPAKLDKFEATVGKPASLVQWGAPWKRRGRLLPFQREYFDAVRSRGAIPVLDWGSGDSCCADDQPDFALQTIIQGDWDDYLIGWAQDAQAWGHPFFLRFDHEMNGWWTAWAEQANGNSPGEFVQAWRHVHDIFVQQGATNVTWVWCPNIVGPQSTPIAGLYPGDDYVDWTCMDGYNWGTDYNNVWQTFAQVFTGDPRLRSQNTYGQLLELAPGKPVMIGETASSENGGSKAAWIKDMLYQQLPLNFQQVKALLWFDSISKDPSFPTESWPVETSPDAIAAFSQGIASPVYPANSYATLEVSPIPPPEFLLPSQAVGQNQ